MVWEDESFDEFANVALPRLMGLARVLTGNQHDASDLTQDTLVKIGLRWRQIDQSGNPMGYARATMVRLHLNQLRRARRDLARMLAAFTGIQQPATDNGGIEYVLEEALNTLPPRQRAAVALRYLEDMSNETIATTLNCSASTVKSHISRGLATLRILLAADDESVIGRQENV